MCSLIFRLESNHRPRFLTLEEGDISTQPTLIPLIHILASCCLENLMKILKHGNLHEKLLVLRKAMCIDGVSQNPTLFVENFIKTVKHGSLHEKLLFSAKSLSFDGFSQNLKLLGTFC